MWALRYFSHQYWSSLFSFLCFSLHFHYFISSLPACVLFSLSVLSFQHQVNDTFAFKLWILIFITKNNDECLFVFKHSFYVLKLTSAPQAKKLYPITCLFFILITRIVFSFLHLCHYIWKFCSAPQLKKRCSFAFLFFTRTLSNTFFILIKLYNLILCFIACYLLYLSISPSSIC